MKTEWMLSAFAVVDLPSGKQVGYFGGFSRQLPRVVNVSPMLRFLGVRNDTIFANQWSLPGGSGAGWCMGINRKTLQLECCIPNVAGSVATVADDVLYVGVGTGGNSGTTIYAVPLAAWK